MMAISACGIIREIIRALYVYDDLVPKAVVDLVLFCREDLIQVGTGSKKAEISMGHCYFFLRFTRF